MKTLHTHDLETREKFDELGGEELLDGYEKELPEGHLTRGFDYPETARELDPDKIKNFITNSHKQLYIKIAEGELARLEEMKKPLIHDVNWAEGYNACLDTQEKYWNNILQELNK